MRTVREQRMQAREMWWGQECTYLGDCIPNDVNRVEIWLAGVATSIESATRQKIHEHVGGILEESAPIA